MDKAVDFFNWKKKHRESFNRQRKENFKRLILNIVMGINIISISTLVLNHGYMQNIVISLGTNIVPLSEKKLSISDIAKIYPALNKDNYIIAKDEPKIEETIVVEKKEEEKKFDGSAVSTFAYNKNEEEDIKISYASNYQKVKMYGFTITNYADKTDIDYSHIMNTELSLSRNKDKILLYCTHTSESYVNSPGYEFSYSGTMRTKDAKYNMLSVASVLRDQLVANKFNVILDTTPHDYTSYDNAYTNSRQTINNQINANGKFGLIIDVHRDAYGSLDNGPTVEINGKEVALIMVVVGIGTEGYENPYWETNLAIAMKILKLGEEMYPGLFRPLLIRGSKYNQDINKGSILTEVGTTGNTHEEVYYAVTCLANILDKVFK